MKRRLILARALMHRPRLLILDEPTAGVDIELRLELWHYVQRINQEGTTILLTTHYLEEAEQLCNRIAFINEGQIVAQGTSAELAARYGVANLEDAYLALVGRKELSRSHIEEAVVRAPPRSASHAVAARGQPLHEDQEADDRRAAAGDLPLHLRLRRRARLADRRAARDRLRRLRHPRPDHDGLVDQRLREQLLLDPAAEVPGRDPGPALLARLAAGAAASPSRSAASCAGSWSRR